MNNKVVARFQDGRLVKGISLDIDPARSTFHIRPPEGETLQVKLEELKALFYVRSLEGDSTHKEDPTLNPGDPRARGSTAVRLRFADGEVMVGLTIRFPPNRPYFFVVPVDQASNNIRVLVNRSSVVSMEAINPDQSVPDRAAS